MIFTNVSIKYLTLKLNYMNKLKEHDNSWIIDKICDRVMSVIYNELDYYMFEELDFTETNDEYNKAIDALALEVIQNLTK